MEFEFQANIMKWFREAEGLSQAQVAKIMGISNGQYVSNIERSLCGASPEQWTLLAVRRGLNPSIFKEAWVKDQTRYYDSKAFVVLENLKKLANRTRKKK